jgi:hypothetical protein
LLDGKDLDLKETDPDKIRETLEDPLARADMIARHQEYRKNVVNSR